MYEIKLLDVWEKEERRGRSVGESERQMEGMDRTTKLFSRQLQRG